MTRLGLFVLLAACGDEHPATHAAAPPPDADPCAAEAPAVPSGCKVSGLANVELGDPWHFAGTIQPYGSTTAQPYGTTVVLTRTGTGWCQFGVTDSASPSGYVDDTHAYFHAIEDWRTSTIDVCAHSDGSIVYHDVEERFAEKQVVDGVLRPAFP